MKKFLLFLIVTIFSLNNSFAQGGVWTWLSGDSTINGLGVYGTQGIPSVNNHPPAAYEYVEWKDKQGNFWVYGGTYPFYSDLWKYDPTANEWTWVKGNGLLNLQPHYGTQGVPDVNNSPGQRSFASFTWVDTTGNLWLFGGEYQNDLWKFNIGTNEWSWMKGDTVYPHHANFGMQGVPSPMNIPGGTTEGCSAWTDSLNNLWMFGGYGYIATGSAGTLNDVWKYDIGTNEWTWMFGSASNYYPVYYGNIGQANWVNDPGGRSSWTKWKDQQGNFWMMGGLDLNAGLCYNDIWKYDPGINLWSWMAGSQYFNPGNYSAYCTYNISNNPFSRYENRAAVTDNCGRFWLFGGAVWWSGVNGAFNDLWIFDPVTLQWNLLSGSNTFYSQGNFGTLGIPANTNLPPSHMGGVAWWGTDNRFYMFGGARSDMFLSSSSDLWVFTPDSICIGDCTNLPTASLVTVGALCPGTCTSFLNLSANATSFQWSFPGATPDTSTAINPNNICYPHPGSYDVQLIASNANGIDTLLITNYITVYPSPPPQSISQNSDTLFSIAGSASYQWYFNGNIINGATNYFYIASSSGDYNVVATDANGCEVEAAVFNVIASVHPIRNQEILIFPNPVGDIVTIHKSEITRETVIEISVFNVIGEKISIDISQSANRLSSLELDVHSLPGGLYYIEMTSAEKTFRLKFVKSTYPASLR